MSCGGEAGVVPADESRKHATKTAARGLIMVRFGRFVASRLVSEAIGVRSCVIVMLIQPDDVVRGCFRFL